MINPPQLTCYTYNKGNKANLSDSMWRVVTKVDSLILAHTDLRTIALIGKAIDDEGINMKQPLLPQYAAPGYRD